MGLNCKPGQRAWIKLPAAAMKSGSGIGALNGRVVQTESISRMDSSVGPCWAVNPSQEWRATQHILAADGSLIFPGTRLWARELPDCWLRPFDDFPPEELDVPAQHLEPAA